MSRLKPWVGRAPVAIAVVSAGFLLGASADLKAVEGSSRSLVVTQAAQELMNAAPAAKLRFDSATGVVRFARFGTAGLHVTAQAGDPQGAAEAFFQAHGQAFGVEDFATQLKLSRRIDDATTGGWVLIYQQAHRGMPVYGGQLRVHTRADLAVTAVHGIFLPDLRIDTRGRVGRDEAAARALESVAQTAAEGHARLDAAVSGPYVYRTGLAQGVAGMDHLVFRVIVSDHATVREILFVDARSGEVVERVPGIMGIDRMLFESVITEDGTRSTEPVWDEGDTLPTGNSDWDTLIYGAEDVYNIFKTVSGGSYLSYDDARATMYTTYGDFPSSELLCPDAQWTGEDVQVCDGMAADDVVAHEWAHAYSEYTHDLFYAYQPGALNEAYSDIFGELADLENGDGTDSPDTVRTDGSCSRYAGASSGEDSYRWLMGEDSSLGVMRDMWTPTCLGQPGKVSDGEYRCGTFTERGDYGGVHTNSGVPNHAFALLVDGGTYNGYTISALGMSKVAGIYWRAMNLYQGTFSDFTDHADSLEAACSDLIGSRAYQVNTTGPVKALGSRYSSSDLTEVEEAMEAVEMRADPPCRLLLTSMPPSPATNGNPLAGQDALSGEDEGTFSGSRATSVIDLSSDVSAGSHFRIRMQSDVHGCNGADGWYIDDVEVFTCRLTTP